MNCEEITSLMDVYVDGELDPITSQKIEQHLRDCGKCEQAYEAHTALTHAISRSVPYYKAPIELRQRVHASLRDEVDDKPTRTVPRGSQLLVTRKQPEPRAVLFGMPWNWLGLAAAVILAAIIFSSSLPRLRQPTSDQFLATQLIASHVRSLMADHLTDVASSDQHTVKPWLDAKLDFAAPVVDLSGEGFPLIGGRLDYLDNHPVAALIYQRRKHFINLFAWPASPGASKAQKTMSRQGYHLLHWVDSDFNYWAVSDVSDGELQTFKRSFQQQIAPH
ncbi:MAG: anti-sigma factor [Verrucomicrobia bacterium]|nr:MAG: anti-sigma factor [Verrucomicrobiota bacterium]PYK52871.1 MAG: anti-sigma factor [Verrucomicrobiota bacterium]PYL64376.1 MAG: anti-sigma factor [Verrucomicrobiota bacterium]